MIDDMSEVYIDSAEVESVDLVSMISKERRDVYKAMRWSRAWKQAAKKARSKFIHADQMVDYYKDYMDAADKRLELLRRFEAMLSWCPFCAGIEPSTGGGIEHLEGCELAEELGDD